MKRMVKWVAGSVCAWFEETSDCGFRDVDAYFDDLASEPNARTER